jgi:hypothetical protein
VIPAAVVGFSWRTPLGVDVASAMTRLLGGGLGAEPFDGGYGISHVARIPVEPGKSKHSRYLRRVGLFGAEVASEAAARAGVSGGPRVGLFAAVGGLRAHWNDMMGALAGQQDDAEGAWARGLGQIHPHWLLRHLSNNAHALIARDLDARGEGATFGGANASAQAIASACRALADGAVDTAVVVAYDTLLEPETLVERAARGAAISGPLAPAYSPAACGPIPGEAAVALVLRPLGAPGAWFSVFAVDGASGDLGEPGAATLEAALRRAGGGACLVDGAARTVPELDLIEQALLSRLMPDARLIATADAFGALGAATSAVQVVTLAHLLRARRSPPSGPAARSSSLELHSISDAYVALGLCTGAPGLVGVVRVEVLV